MICQRTWCISQQVRRTNQTQYQSLGNRRTGTSRQQDFLFYRYSFFFLKLTLSGKNTPGQEAVHFGTSSAGASGVIRLKRRFILAFSCWTGSSPAGSGGYQADNKACIKDQTRNKAYEWYTPLPSLLAYKHTYRPDDRRDQNNIKLMTNRYKLKVEQLNGDPKDPLRFLGFPQDILDSLNDLLRVLSLHISHCRVVHGIGDPRPVSVCIW